MPNFPDPSVLLSRLKEKMQEFNPQAPDPAKADEAQVHEPDKKELFSDEVKRLKKAHKLLAAENKFKIGDIVQWKAGLKNLTHPNYERPALVTEVLVQPIMAGTQDSDPNEFSPHYNEPLNMKVLVALNDREIMEFYVDSRRFEKSK